MYVQHIRTDTIRLTHTRAKPDVSTKQSWEENGNSTHVLLNYHPPRVDNNQNDIYIKSLTFQSTIESSDDPQVAST